MEYHKKDISFRITCYTAVNWERLHSPLNSIEQRRMVRHASNAKLKQTFVFSLANLRIRRNEAPNGRFVLPSTTPMKNVRRKSLNRCSFRLCESSKIRADMWSALTLLAAKPLFLSLYLLSKQSAMISCFEMLFLCKVQVERFYRWRIECLNVDKYVISLWWVSLEYFVLFALLVIIITIEILRQIHENCPWRLRK